ncbi:hypothetical protein [Ferrimonas marina]|uniref:Membrane-bound lysozyme-inhibitor of c-type lysozyme n=1 Tax=Ferrimonas marina TaxID=299255 RepID=A0A1M5YVP4_9GAMM|nr:hypothetical protein [Ferrimonas marina]SHI16157.1 hypothetical protein SAMN02745129_4532 [Ferrimonas marina]
MRSQLRLLAYVLCSTLFVPAQADSTNARCELQPDDAEQAPVTLDCTFSQRQGYITIARSDGVEHQLTPTGDSPGNFVDQNGSPVYRQSGLGDQGLIFRFPAERLLVYWQAETVPTKASKEASAASPFSNKEYDATTQLACRREAQQTYGQCPAAVLRMEDKQASVVVQSPKGEVFTLNFMRDYINATNRAVEAKQQGDSWVVIVEGEEEYRVPLAFIEGR